MCSLVKRGSIYILTLTGDDDHCLNPDLITKIRSLLSEIRSDALMSPSCLITTAQGKFFSNGFDLAWAKRSSTPTTSALQNLNHMVSLFAPLVADLLSLPIPTIAAVTGHAAAAGFMLAICHDYVVMRSDRGVLYMSELDIGLPFPPYFVEIMKAKIGGDSRVLRDVMLRAKKLNGKEAKEMGVVDIVMDDGEKTLKTAVELAEELVGRKWNGKVYSSIRMAMFPNLCKCVGLVNREFVPSKL